LLGDILSELLPQIEERRANPTSTPGIPTGFIDIDNLLGGIRKQEMIYIAGEPGVGKSLLMLCMGLNMAKAGHPGAIFSLEMKAETVGRRALSALSMITTNAIETGRVNDAEMQSVAAAVNDAGNVILAINDDAELTLSGLRSELVRLRSLYNIEWFALDYLLLLNGCKAKDETERSSILSRGTRQIANALELAALTVNSVTKEGMGDTANIANRSVRGSSGVVHDADIIAFLVKDKAQPQFPYLAFTKLRNVPGGDTSIVLHKHPTLPLFSNAQKRDINGR